MSRASCTAGRGRPGRIPVVGGPNLSEWGPAGAAARAASRPQRGEGAGDRFAARGRRGAECRRRALVTRSQLGRGSGGGGLTGVGRVSSNWSNWGREGFDAQNRSGAAWPPPPPLANEAGID